MNIKGTRFSPIIRNDNDTGYESAVLNGSDAVLYRTATAKGRYLPTKLARKTVGYGIATMGDRCEVSLTTEEGEPLTVALSHDLIMYMARLIKERNA